MIITHNYYLSFLL